MVVDWEDLVGIHGQPWSFTREMNVMAGMLLFTATQVGNDFLCWSGSKISPKLEEYIILANMHTLRI